MRCCNNECNEPSTWSLGNAISACDLHKEELKKSLEGWHHHEKCDKCKYVFHVDKLCDKKDDHEFLCIICL